MEKKINFRKTERKAKASKKLKKKVREIVNVFPCLCHNESIFCVGLVWAVEEVLVGEATVPWPVSQHPGQPSPQPPQTTLFTLHHHDQDYIRLIKKNRYQKTCCYSEGIC